MTEYRKIAEDALANWIDINGNPTEEVRALARALLACDRERQEALEDHLAEMDRAEGLVRLALTYRQALEQLANEAARAVTEPRRFHENGGTA